MLTFTPSRPVKAGLADRLVFGGTLAVLVFAPLAFGSVHVWAYTICVMAVAVLLTLKALDVLLTPGGTGPGWVCTPLTLPAALLAVLAALQLAPLPLAWLARLSPLAAADRAVLAEVLARAGAAAPAWGAAAYHPHAAGIKSLLLLTAFGMWLLVVHTARTRQRIDLLAWTLAAVGLFEALYGLGQAFGAAPGVWWWPSRTAPMASGTFVGANHFASYLILVLPLTLGFAMAHRRPRLRMTQGLGGGRAALQRLLDLFAPEAAAPRRLVLFGAALVMGLGLLLSGSRGGIVALAAALLLTAAMMVRRSRTRQQGLLTILFCLAVLLFGLGVGIDHTMADFAFEKAQAGLAMRWERSKSLVPMLADYPLAGVGLGSWRDLYGRYVPEGIGYLNAGHAHNDWLEVGTELGLPGLAVMALGFAALWIKLARAWQGRRDPHALGLGAGVLAGITALALHSFFEFSLHIPANPLTLATVAGLGYAALHRHSRGLLEHFSCPTRRPPETGWARAALAVTLVLAAGLVRIPPGGM